MSDKEIIKKLVRTLEKQQQLTDEVLEQLDAYAGDLTDELNEDLDWMHEEKETLEKDFKTIKGEIK